MKHILKTFTLVFLCVAMSANICAQKKNVSASKKSISAAAVKTFPQRDSAFKADHRLLPIGQFNPNDVQKLEYFVMPTPDFTGHLLERNNARKQVKLTQFSCKQNQIIDDEDWVERNNLVLRQKRVETPMNLFAPRYQYRTGGYLVTTYGMNWGSTLKVVVTDEEQKTLYAAYDFENYKFSPKTTLMGNDQSVNDFVIEGNILYVAHGTNGYSDGVGYQTGYITAFDMETNEIVWTTQPLTCNSHFAIVDNSIICGYGFTSEPDNLFVLDKYSGQRVQKIPMKKMVNEVVRKGDMLYVRTYSFDYVFNIK